MVCGLKDIHIYFSHSHGMNGHLSADGSSILISFLCLDDLVTYLYAFNDNLRIYMTLQFDFLPVTVRTYECINNSKRQFELG